MSVRTIAPSSARSTASPSFYIEQSSRLLRLRAHEPWERLRLMDPSGKTHRESSGLLSELWDISELAGGVYWVVAEWIGTRSSRAIVLD